MNPKCDENETAANTAKSEPDKTILVVDDNSLNLALIAYQIKMLGYKVATAGNGMQALELLQRNNYLMIMTDCQMPEMDGFQLAGEIRKLEKNGKERIPVIAISADELDKTGSECSDFDECLVKPIDINTLSNAIRRLII